MRTERLELVASKEVLGLMLREDLSAAAVDALEDGWDSPCLRVLAGLTETEADQARSLFGRALAEMNVPRRSPRDAALHLARKIAERILGRETTPYEGAKQVWELCLLLPDEHLSELDPFVYAASEWEDRPQDRQIFEDGIPATAKDLVST